MWKKSTRKKTVPQTWTIRIRSLSKNNDKMDETSWSWYRIDVYGRVDRNVWTKSTCGWGDASAVSLSSTITSHDPQPIINHIQGIYIKYCEYCSCKPMKLTYDRERETEWIKRCPFKHIWPREIDCKRDVYMFMVEILKQKLYIILMSLKL